MFKQTILCGVVLTFMLAQAFAQADFIHSTEGKAMMNRQKLIDNCLKGMRKKSDDPTALSICQCEADKLEGHFTKKQYWEYTMGNEIDLASLIRSDSAFAREIERCFTASGKTILLHAQEFENDFVAECIKNIQRNTEKKLDNNRLVDFCLCQLNLVKTRKLSDAQIATLSNPNSLLFYELMYTCGNPFAGKEQANNGWNSTRAADVEGPAADTVDILTMNGMTYVKMKTGSMIQFWLLDTGASDLLINREMEATLRQENIISDSSYLGTGEYEMANGRIDTCRRYSINNVRIGKSRINNLVVAVSDNGIRIIAGKALLNKFSNWMLDNRKDVLILNK